MCTSYCNTCNYCVSNCSCTSTTTVPPCTASTGCIDTNYADCVFWRGDNIASCNVTVTSGDTIEDAIVSLHTAICALTPTDLDWTSFNYDCLGPFTTAQEFAEGVSAAICALNGSVDVTPNVTISGGCSTYFSGITPGTSTMIEILDDFIVKLCDLNTFNTTGTVTTACSAGVWSTLPAGTSLKGWINWIKSNVCSLVLAVQGRATDLETFQSDVMTFAGTLDLIDNTDCLGGSGSDDLQVTLALIKNKLCSIDTTVSALPDLTNLSLPWTTCGGTIGGAWAGYANYAALTTHLSRIVTQLAARTYNFSGDFSTAAGACGTTVSLATAVTPFTCGDLGTCSIHNLADVDPNTLGTGSGDKFKVLSWSTTSSTWNAKPLVFTSSGGTVDVGTKTDDGSTLTYNFDANLTDGGNSDDTGLASPVDLVIGAASGGSRALSLKYNSNYFNNPLAVTYTPAASVSASGYVSDTSTAIKVGGVVHLGGAYDIVIAAPVATGNFYTIGSVNAVGIPASSNRIIATTIVDVSNDNPYNVWVQIDTSGNIQIKNVIGAGLSAATYAICLSGIHYTV